MIKKNMFFIVAFFLLSCKGEMTGNNIPAIIKVAHQSMQEDRQDPSLVVNGSRLFMLDFAICNKAGNDTVMEEIFFLNTNIKRFRYDTVMSNQLDAELYYRSFLTGTNFLAFEESSFNKANCSFSITQSVVKDYGVCFIGKYYFPRAINAAQRRATVIINTDRKEVSIWNFDDINIIKDGLSCNFNVRGKHTIYKISYAAKSECFVYSSVSK